MDRSEPNEGARAAGAFHGRLRIDLGTRGPLARRLARALFSHLAATAHADDPVRLECYRLTSSPYRTELDTLFSASQAAASRTVRDMYVWAERALDRLGRDILVDEDALIFDARPLERAVLPFVECAATERAAWFGSGLPAPLRCRLATLAAEWIAIDQAQLKSLLPTVLSWLLQPIWPAPLDPRQASSWLLTNCDDDATRNGLIQACISVASEPEAWDAGSGASLQRAWLNALAPLIGADFAGPDAALAGCRALLALLGFAAVETDYLLLLASVCPHPARQLPEIHP